ncbi:co-chaperone GroES [candidate division LCP-89 bacterium B3_LCP]|uniref:Co-chaperonin GroES n=1 Tax=candidate division LCP-89 bacterium B3_LCP TaxID=2012998 RepID=A0A532UQL3_UNCL8|nr:MAG: co-chaperone GroES [candidate division LCP-89 bacterium B3_LCP]
MSIGIKPVDERVLIQPLESEEQKVGSIIIPDTAKERPQIGTVIAIGDDLTKKDGGKVLSEILKVGDKVVYAKYGGTEIKHENQEYLIVSRSDILAVVKG